MVPNGDSKITEHIYQSQFNNHLNERMVLFLLNLEVFLVPVLYVDVLGITKQNLEWTQVLFATNVENIGHQKVACFMGVSKRSSVQ